ncbi:MAG: LppX_LprAFG lipoprotein [Pseudonocardiaceae bacterium]
MRRIIIVLLALLAMITSGCTSDDAPEEQLPDATALLREAAEAASKITSTHFTLTVNGEVPGLAVRSVEGDLTAEGAAKGTASLSMGGQLIEGEFVLVDDAFYLKGATGGFQRLPAAMITSIYDPSSVLDPERGIANLLRTVGNAQTEAVADVAGTPTYKVTGTVAKDVIAGLVPGITSDVNVTLWLAKEGQHLPVKASAALPAEGGQSASVDVTLSDVDKPVTVTTPR